MPHLNLETLARLVDEAPDAAETAHLDACAACRAGLDEMREDVQALGMLPVVAPVGDAWPALEQRLRAEGLISTSHGRRAWPRLMQMAAAVVLFLAGSLAGRMLTTPQPIMTTADATSNAVDSDPIVDPAAAGSLAALPADDEAATIDDNPGMDGARVATMDRPLPGPPAGVRLAASGFTGSPATIEEAGALLRETEQLYLAALTRYAELATQSDAGDPVARLAALQSIVMTTQAALDQTPADPVINGVHLATLAQRDATLAQVAAVSGERWYD